MKRSIFCIVLSLIVPLLPVSAEGTQRHLYLCRSPLLAYDFWRSLLDIRQRGVTIMPQIVEQICDGMRAGSVRQCIRVNAAEFKPIASGWGGALQMTDGKTTVFFNHPDTGGWVHPDYYVSYVNGK